MRVSEIISAAGEAKLIGIQVPDKKKSGYMTWSQKGGLYDATSIVPKLSDDYAGWIVVTSKNDPEIAIDGKSAWCLRGSETPF